MAAEASASEPKPVRLEDTVLEDFASETDALFDSWLNDALSTTPGKAKESTAPKAAPLAANSSLDIESEYALLEKNIQSSTKPSKQGVSPGAASVAQDSTGHDPFAPANVIASPGPGGVATFELSDGESSGEEDTSVETKDYRPPPVPAAPSDFTPEDLALRDALIEFYLGRKQDNISNVNLIVKKYRGRNAMHLWAQLGIKYKITPAVIVEQLAKTIYTSAPFEYDNEEEIIALEQAMYELREDGTTDRLELFRRALARGAKDGSEKPLRVLCFRGIPEDGSLRPQVWKVLLGYLPMSRHSEWNAIQQQKRDLYTSYKSQFLLVSEEHTVQAHEAGQSADQAHDSRDLLQEIHNDVERTRRDCEYFNRPATRSTLLSILFVYARLNPGVRYVQGMNEVAAVLLYVMSGDSENVEADAFWCFNELMAEIKEGFMQALDTTHEGIHGWVGRVNELLRRYDPDLAKHIQKHELALIVFVLRWVTVLFAQDATLANVVRFWDSLVADPRRFEFCLHLCLASILAHREQLLDADKQISLAEILQSAPRRCDPELQLRRAWAICAFERRAQTPPFPPKSTAATMDELQEMAQTAAVRAHETMNRAQEVGAEVAKNLQENVAPVVAEKASQAAAAAAVAAADGAQAMSQWLEHSAPARKEAMEKAQTQISSLWSIVRDKSSELAAKGHGLASEYSQKESVENATGAASAAFSRGASFLSQVGRAETQEPVPTLIPEAGDVASEPQQAAT